MRRAKQFAIVTLLSLVLLAMLFPFAYMIAASLSQGHALPKIENLLELDFSLTNYHLIFRRGGLGRFLFNSVIVVTAVTIANLVFCLMAGYSLARGRFAANRLLYLSAAGVLMIPTHILIIPLFTLMTRLGLYDSYWALILPFAVNPFGVLLMTQYIKALPIDCEEAARLDGAGQFRILAKIVAPMCRPALGVLAIQVFLTNWNSFVFPFILTSSPEKYTLPVGLAMMQGMQGMTAGQMMASSTIATLPIFAVFLFFQRQIIEGITAGALKG